LFVYIICSVAGCFYFTYSFAVGFGSSYFAAPVVLLNQSFGTQYLYGFYWAFYSLFGLTLVSHRPVGIGEIFFSLVMVGTCRCCFGFFKKKAKKGCDWVVLDCGSGGGAGQSAARDGPSSRALDGVSAAAQFFSETKGGTKQSKCCILFDPVCSFQVQQWIVAVLNAEPVFRGLEPAVIRSLAMRCKVELVFCLFASFCLSDNQCAQFKAFPKRVALVVEGEAPGAALFMLRKGVLEETRGGVHQV